LLGVRLTERGESFYNSRLPGLVRRLEEGGVAQQSEGATVVFLDGYQQGDGSPLPLVRLPMTWSTISSNSYLSSSLYVL
jgi:arginyl-tRNA synthetase